MNGCCEVARGQSKLKHGRGRRWAVLPEHLRLQMLRMWRDGHDTWEIAHAIQVSRTTVYKVLKPLGGVIRPELVEVPDSRLALDDRVEIRLALEAGCTYREIADRIGWHHSTVCREVNKNGGKQAYRPMQAHRRAREQARRPKSTKLSCNERLRDEVANGLEKLWSPQQIANRLRDEFGDDDAMRVSHETIYKSLYVQGRGELRRELTRNLRSGRAQRIPQGRSERAGRIPDMVMISERPAEADDRAVPGHWEGDLIIGKDGASAVGTLVERSTRFVMLLHLPHDRTAKTVRKAMQHKIQTLPAALHRSITWDQGREMAQHAQFTVDTGIPIYFCDPHSPWQRGSNENTNGLLRQYMPKSTDLSAHDPDALDRIADSLNGRPRETLNWKTPSEKLNELLLQ
jgi:IS30 family transposase